MVLLLSLCLTFYLLAKLLPVISVPENCPCCNEAGVLEQRPTTGTIIVINEKGSV